MTKYQRTNTISNLTERETEVLNLVIKGLSNPKISKILNISVSTVKAHVKSITRKFHVHNRLEILLYTIKHHPEMLK